MKAPIPGRTGHSVPSAGLGRRVSIWFLSIALAFGFILGQFAEAATAAEHHAEGTLAGLTASPAHVGIEATPAAACQPAIAAFVVPAGSAPAGAGSLVSILCPDATRSQRPRFGGPTVTLPPPRTLI